MVKVDNYTIGGTAQFACVDGYRYLDGDLIWTCDDSGYWDGSEITCAGEQCAWDVPSCLKFTQYLRYQY